MLHLPGGARLDGDDELVHRAVDDGQSGGDGLYVADIAEATGLPEPRVREVVAGLADQGVLTGRAADDELGPRWVTGAGG